MADETRTDPLSIHIQDYDGVGAATRQDTRKKAKTNGVLLFGAGNNGQQLARLLAAQSSAPGVLGFVSDIAEHQGGVIEGAHVWSRADALRRFGPDVVLINCVYRSDISIAVVTRGLHASGFQVVIPLPLFYCAFQDILPAFYCFSNPDTLSDARDQIGAALSLMNDEESRRTFGILLRQRVELDFKTSRDFDRNIYFPNFLTEMNLGAPGATFVFVDCGAYNGDTLEKFSGWYCGADAHVVAFEPDHANFLALKRTAASVAGSKGLSVSCIQAAVGGEIGEIGFAGLNSESSHVSKNAESTVRMTTVDSELSNLNLAASYVKYDTEGFEREAIAGTRKAIANRASLAISVYHKPRDLWEIPLLIDRMGAGYKFYLREHGPDGIDTVLYALAA